MRPSHPAAASVPLLVALLAAMSAPVQACGMGWWDLERAERAAVEDGRLLVLVFTGNDWSLASMQLDQRVFEDGEFAYRFGSTCLPVNIDFPQRLPLSDEALAFSRSYAARFHVRHFATFIVLRPDGSLFARHEYHGEDSATMLKLVNGWLTRWQQERLSAQVDGQ
jgi:hypothetical protein